VIGSLIVDGGLRDRLAGAGRGGDGAGAGRPARGPLVGTVVTLPDVGLAELTATAADLVWIDLEHGALSARDVQPLAIAAGAAGAASLVRLRSSADLSLGPVLDAGVDGVVVPRVETPEEAEDLVERLRYPPRGSRGLAARRASGYGVGAGEDPVCIVQIESAAAVSRADAIAAVGGVDALVVGAADLAADLGDRLGPASPGLPEAIADVSRACQAAGIAFGLAGPADPELLLALGGPDAQILVLGADVRLYALAITGALELLRQGPAHDAPEREEAHVCT